MKKKHSFSLKFENERLTLLQLRKFIEETINSLPNSEDVYKKYDVAIVISALKEK